MTKKENKLRSEIARLGTKLNKRMRKANKTRSRLENAQRQLYELCTPKEEKVQELAS